MTARRRSQRNALSILLAAGCVLSTHAQDHARCAGLAGVAFAHASVERATWQPAGTVEVPAYPPGTVQRVTVTAHCDVKVVSRPVPGSEIHVSVWMPAAEEWNGRLLATGNGGYSSALSVREMAARLQQGYAVGGSDTGHTGDGLAFGTHNPEGIRDWAYRATHELASAERVVARRYYGKAAQHAIFMGCSTGGQQALSEAQRYPMDFDGIVAGDPGSDRIRLNADFVASWRIAHAGTGTVLPHAKLALLAHGAMAACDDMDGVKDGVIADPRACRFDPTDLLCRRDGDPAQCLTPAEVSAAQQLYSGAVRDDAGRPMYFGWPRGSELGWGSYIIDPPRPVRIEFWSDWVYGGRPVDPATFDAQRAIADARAKLPFVEAVSPDLQAFAARGGKLVMYHGWADPVVPPENSVAYAEAVRQHTRGDVLALYMVPGMMHCGGGPGATSFDPLEALNAWWSEGSAPESLRASRLDGARTMFTRPICRYPMSAVWDGHGDPDKMESFSCNVTTQLRSVKR